ncbi:MAG: hypothetical protein H7Z41_06755 [Cytophagales bacterium]|nr:hypothetical protein [Armatimonadota bacterium]
MSDDTRAGTPIVPQGTDSIRNEPIPDETGADRSLLNHMIRRPVEADFEEVLTPEGNSGDIAGSDVIRSSGPSNDSLGGTG